MDSVSDLNINQYRNRPSGSSPGLLIFNIDKYEFGIDHQYVKEITKFSDSDFAFENKLTYNIIFYKEKHAIVNIRNLLEFSNITSYRGSSVILVNTFSKCFGFFVDKIVETIIMNKLLTEGTLDFILPVRQKGRFSGVLKLRNRRILILNLEKITREFDRVIKFPRQIKGFSK